MNLTVFSGKGGVGKSTSAAAASLNLAESQKVLMADYDGGHSLARVLDLEDQSLAQNLIHSTGIRNLSLAVIDQLEFESIVDWQKKRKKIQGYLAQFKEDYGLIPFCDMVTAFFGPPTDIESVAKFASLTRVLYDAKEKNIQSVVLDVEPTAGLERLLNSSAATARSLVNLQKLGWATLRVLGVPWPDIAVYLKGDYIKLAEKYTARIVKTAEALKSARYVLVTIPERSPVDQLGDVKRIVSAYGGKVEGYVINNIRGEPHESEQIKRVLSASKGMPVVQVKHDIRLCDSNPSERRKALKEVGTKLKIVLR